jgi:CheY-like chemotaxis protein
MVNEIFRCRDGDEALDYLHQRGEFAEIEKAPRPGMILLDLNMPGTDGKEVLQEIREVPELRKIPVIVLTTSTDERDVAACYELGANSYIEKPVSLSGYVDAIQRMKDYWFKIVVFPT